MRGIEVVEHRVGDRCARHHLGCHRSLAHSSSVQEVPFAREHHREAELVGALDDLLVAAPSRRAAPPPRRRRRRRPRCRRGTGRTRRTRTRRPRRGPRPSSPRSRPTRRGSAARRRCRRPGRPSPARSRSTSRARRCATRARRRATRSSVGARLVTTRQSSRPAAKWCGVLHEEPAGDLAEVEARAASGAGASSRRVFLRFLRSASIVPSS